MLNNPLGTDEQICENRESRDAQIIDEIPPMYVLHSNKQQNFAKSANCYSPDTVKNHPSHDDDSRLNCRFGMGAEAGEGEGH